MPLRFNCNINTSAWAESARRMQEAMHFAEAGLRACSGTFIVDSMSPEWVIEKSHGIPFKEIGTGNLCIRTDSVNSIRVAVSKTKSFRFKSGAILTEAELPVVRILI